MNEPHAAIVFDKGCHQDFRSLLLLSAKLSGLQSFFNHNRCKVSATYYL